MRLSWRRCTLRVRMLLVHASAVPARGRLQAARGVGPPLAARQGPNGEKPAAHYMVNPQEIREGPLAGAGTRISGEAET